MKLTETGLAGVYIVEPAVFGDHRGFFMESWSKRAFEAAGLQYEFVQDNHSSSAVKGHPFPAWGARPGEAGAVYPGCGAGRGGGPAWEKPHI